MDTTTKTTEDTTMTTLTTGDSTRGFTSVIIATNGQVAERDGSRELCRRMLAAFRRGEKTVVTSAGDELAMRVERRSR